MRAPLTQKRLATTDLRLEKGSPAADAGVPLPAEWPDLLRDRDAGRPDIGAIPLGAVAWAVGPRKQ